MTFSFMRAHLLRIIKDNEPINGRELGKLAEISEGRTLFRYIQELERRGLIITKKQGQSRILKTTTKARALPLPLFKIEKKLKEALK